MLMLKLISESKTRKFTYIKSISVMFLCMMVIVPTTVYASETSPLSGISNVQTMTGAAIPTETLPVSLVYSLNTYLVSSFSEGRIDINTYNSVLNSGLISENAFFANTVFIGDSLTVGFEDYCRKNPDSIATPTTHFLARVSGSAKAAISPNALTTYSKIMPLYNGQAQYIEDSVAQMTDVNKAFICFGMNDLVGSSPEQFVSDMQTLISRILAKRPELKIYIISIPCVVADVSTGNLCNDSIQTANLIMQGTCAANGWGFVNLSEYLMGEGNALRPEYSSDNYVHENSKAYSIWNRVLKNYAYMEITN